MAMGLGFLGRGGKREDIGIGLIHVCGGIVGGAAAGGIIGWLGSLFMVAPLHRWVIGVVAASALILSVTKPQRTLGVSRQVPRDWRGKISATPRYLLWGLLLGAGVATLVPYSAYLVLLAAQFSSGAIVGCLSGAIFGGLRTIPALVALLRLEYRLRPAQILQLLPALRPAAKLLNTVTILTLGASLLAVQH